MARLVPGLAVVCLAILPVAASACDWQTPYPVQVSAYYQGPSVLCVLPPVSVLNPVRSRLLRRRVSPRRRPQGGGEGGTRFCHAGAGSAFQ